MASNRLVMIWNWSMASWLYCGSPKLSPAEFCVTCWPSTLICSLPPSVVPSGELVHVVARDAGDHHRQLEIIAPVEGDTADFRRADVAGNGGGAGIDGRGCRFHGDGGARGCQLQRHVDRGNLPHQHGESALGRNESRDLKPQDVFAGAHRGYLIHSLPVGLRREFRSILSGRSDHYIRHDRVRRIGQSPGNAGLLCKCRRDSHREGK